VRENENWYISACALNGPQYKRPAHALMCVIANFG